MAVTSIWRVKGWLGKVVIYVENPEKTTNPEYYQSDAITDHQCQGLEDVISYAVNSNKTHRVTDEWKAAEVKESISHLSSQLATLRREVKLCNDIALRSGMILEHIQMEKAKEQSVRKEKTEHEQRRRCSGTNR